MGSRLDEGSWARTTTIGSSLRTTPQVLQFEWLSQQDNGLTFQNV